jgi:flagellar motor switch protein FliM
VTALAERKVEAAALDTPRLPPGEIPGLDRIAQRFARGLGQTLPGYGLNARVATATVRTARADAWHDGVAGDAWIKFAIPELSSHATLTFPFPLIVEAIDRYYGGEGNCATDPRDFTPAEQRSLRSLGKALAPAIASAWGEVAAFSPVVEDAGAAVLRPAAAKLDELLSVQDFTLTDTTGKDWTMTCAMAQEPLHRVPGLKVEAGPAREISPVWTSNLKDAVMDVRFPVRTVLARPDLALERLLTLAPGDVIPVLLPAFVPLSVGGRVIGHGTIGEENGRAAIRLERMEKGFGR